MYKVSLFSSVIPLENNFYLLYNSFTDKYVVVHSTDAITLNGLLSLPRDSKILKDAISSGLLVDSTIDEEKKLMDRVNSVLSTDKIFQLFINPTLNCNFNCWYCYEDHNNKPLMHNQMLSSIYLFLDKTIKSNTNLEQFCLSFFGGEPLLGFERIAYPIIQKCQELCDNHNIKLGVHFTTNGYLLNDDIINYLATVGASFQITLDGSREFHNKVRFTNKHEGSYDKIIDNIVKLATRGCEITVRINYTIQNVKSVEDIINDLEKLRHDYRRYIRIDLQRVWQDIEQGSIQENTEEYLTKFKNIGFCVNEHALRNGTFSPCYADFHNQILINYNGDIFKCTARDFEKNKRLGYISQNGDTVWDQNHPTAYSDMKFHKKICRKCRIAPICGSSCCQKNIENVDSPDCNYNYSDENIDSIILHRFERGFVIS